MAFKTYGTKQSSTKTEVDYDALNKYVVETADLQERSTLTGFISGIVDLGEQEQPDAEYEFDGDADDEAAEIKEHPNTYFKDGENEKGKKVRLKCFPQRPTQCVAIAVDFPDIIIDKGQFYGNSNPQPLRMWLGGSFFIPNRGMVIGRPTPLSITKKSGSWSFAANHLFYKMAVDAKLVKPGEAFLPQDIDQLLGKSFQFQVQVYFKENKGKSYFTEYIKYQGALGRKDKPWEPETEPFLIEFDGEHTAENMQNLRNHVINTIKGALNYNTSEIKKYIEKNAGTGEGSDSAQKEESSKQTKSTARKQPVKAATDDTDDDVPF